LTLLVPFAIFTALTVTNSAGYCLFLCEPSRLSRIKIILLLASLNNIFMNWIVPLVGSLAAVVLLFFLYRELDASLFFEALVSANPLFLGMLCLSVLAEQLLRGFKWRHILYDLKPVSAYRLFGAILAGED